MKVFFGTLFLFLLAGIGVFLFSGGDDSDLAYEEIELEEEVFKKIDPLPSTPPPGRSIASLKPQEELKPLKKQVTLQLAEKKNFDQLNDLRNSEEFSKDLKEQEKSIEAKESWLRSYSETMLEAIKLTLTDSEEEQEAFDELTDYIGELFAKQDEKEIAKITNKQMVAARVPKGGMERLEEMTN